MSVNLDELSFDHVKFVGWDALTVKNRELVTEYIFLGYVSKVGVAATGDRSLTLGHDSQVSLIVIVKVSQVQCQVSVADLARLIIMELHQVLVQLFLLLLHGGGWLQSPIENLH